MQEGRRYNVASNPRAAAAAVTCQMDPGTVRREVVETCPGPAYWIARHLLLYDCRAYTEEPDRSAQLCAVLQTSLSPLRRPASLTVAQHAGPKPLSSRQSLDRTLVDSAERPDTAIWLRLPCIARACCRQSTVTPVNNCREEASATAMQSVGSIDLRETLCLPYCG